MNGDKNRSDSRAFRRRKRADDIRKDGECYLCGGICEHSEGCGNG